MDKYTQQYNDMLYIRLFEMYNQAFSKVWQGFISEHEKNDKEPAGFSEAEYNDVHNSIQEWYKTPISDDDQSITGSEILDKIVDFDEALKLAEYAAVYCDDEIPDIVKIKLNSFGQDPRARVMEHILAKNWEDVAGNAESPDQQRMDAEPVVVASLIRLLGEWEFAEGIEPLIAHFARQRQPAEIIAEAMRDYLRLFEEQPVEAIVATIKDSLTRANDLNAACEYLLITLTDIGKEHPDGQILSCLKECFRKMGNKAIAAICLGDYGDGRAIPVLRGWLDMNPQVDDRQILYEIVSAIQRLGGDISDLKPRLTASQRY
jgi:hypothetical protein